MQSFDTVLRKDENSSLSWNFKIPVSAALAAPFLKPDKRILCYINDNPYFHCALMPDGNGAFFIMINKELRKKFKLEAGDTIQVKIEKDTSEYGMFVPEAFTALCEQDPEGKAFFHALTKGKQRNLLHLMGKPKSEQKQMEKTLIIFDYLKSVNGKLDFKELHEAFKNSRFKL